MMNKPPLATLHILLPDIEKAAFKRACFVNHTTMTRQLRKFIHQYCATAERPDTSVYDTWLTEHQRDLFKRENTASDDSGAI